MLASRLPETLNEIPKSLAVLKLYDPYNSEGVITLAK